MRCLTQPRWTALSALVLYGPHRSQNRSRLVRPDCCKVDASAGDSLPQAKISILTQEPATLGVKSLIPFRRNTPTAARSRDNCAPTPPAGATVAGRAGVRVARSALGPTDPDVQVFLHHMLSITMMRYVASPVMWRGG